MPSKTNKKTKKKLTKSQPSRTKKKAPIPQASRDQPLRDHLLFLLKDGGAHIGFDDAVRDWPLNLTGVKIAKFPHTAWMLLEHMRIALWDIVEFSRSTKHVSPKWPEGYWPASDAPPDEKTWAATIAAIKKEMQTMERLVADRKNDLYARFPWGDGQTLLRQALLIADHNAYHLGQLVTLRKGLSI
jgi:hypothetical protein